MLEKINKYKFILIFIIFILFLFLNNKVNANTEIKFNYNNEDYTAILPQDFLYYTISYCYDGYFWLNATNISSCVKAVYNFQGSFHYVRFQDSSGVNLTESRYYSTDLKNWTYRDGGWDGLVRNELKSFCYSNIDVYNGSGNIIHVNDYVEPSPFHLEYNENTKSFFVYTDYMEYKTFRSNFAYFNINGLQTTFSFDTYENYGWKLMYYKESPYLTSDGLNDFLYYQEIFEYGEYYFCLFNFDTKTHNIYCINITKDSSSISKYNENYTDSSDIFIEIEHNDYEYKEYLSNDNQNFYINYIDNIANVYSNYYKEDDSYYYDCLYSKDYVNYSDDVITEYYDGANTNYSNYYRFYKEIYENGTYYFRLRKIDKNTGSIISSNIYTVIVDGIVVNSVGENDTIEYYKNTNVVKYFREKLGIVFYPIDMVINFMERLENLSSQEPSITVPDIKEPFSGQVFINGFTFSLNDVLVNENIAYIYNIYLYFVDFILYTLLFGLFIKIFKSYSSFNGGVS